MANRKVSSDKLESSLIAAWRESPDDAEITAGLAALAAKKQHAKMWRPIPNSPQKKAFDSDAFEVLYGGGLGGGKTDLILSKPFYKHRNALILRRTFPEVERTFVERSSQIYGKFGTFNAGKYHWLLNYKGEHKVQFGHVDNVGDSFERPGDAQRYAGPSYDYIGFDQLEQFPEYIYLFLLTRARTAIEKQKVQVVSTANPVGEHIDWIIKRWAPWLDETYPFPAEPGEIRYFKRTADNREIECKAKDKDAISRTYIPSRLADNPYLGDDYRRTINLMPEPARSALLQGDWKAMLTDDAYQVIPREWIKAAMERWERMPTPNWAISAVGIDCARGGEDKHVIAERRRNWFAQLRKFDGSKVKRGQDALALMRDIPVGDATINIDVIGIGSSVFDFISEKYNAVAVNVGEKSDEEKTDKSKKFTFMNLRAQYAWALRDALDPEYNSDVALPNDPELLGDLVAMRYKIVGSKIKIELKEEIKKRLGRSPDCGEAVILANANTATKQKEISTAYDDMTESEVLGSIGLKAW